MTVTVSVTRRTIVPSAEVTTASTWYVPGGSDEPPVSVTSVFCVPPGVSVPFAGDGAQPIPAGTFSQENVTPPA